MRAALGNIWTEFWAERNPRERNLLAGGAALIAVVVVYSVLWAPAHDNSARIQADLPGLQGKLAQMTAQSTEARALAGATLGPAPSGSALRDGMLASFSTHGLPPGEVTVSGGSVRVTLSNAPFSAWVSWLDEMRKRFKVQVTETHVTALKEDGQVDVSATLQPTRALP